MAGSKVTSGGFSLKVETGAARDLAKQFRAAGDDLSDLKAANTEAAGIAAAETRARVPRQSGTLAATIRSTGTKSAGVIRAGKKSVPYAGVIHFGTEKAKSDFWKAHKIVGQPFAADAAKATEPIWGKVYQEAVQRALQRIKGA